MLLDGFIVGVEGGLQGGDAGIGDFPQVEDVLKSSVVFAGASLVGLEILQEPDVAIGSLLEIR